jgi:tRNA threonylcarbamoyladenosine biosynthesis protein TsaE
MTAPDRDVTGGGGPDEARRPGEDMPVDRPAIKCGTVEVADEGGTARFAAALAAGLRAGDVVCLHGDLGAGKTAFARAAIRALTGDPDEEVPSPTFTLVQTYPTGRGLVWHFDLYRLSGPDEVFELGWEEATADGIVLVEWPDRLGSLRPARRIDVTLEGAGEGPRRILVARAG